MDHQVHPWTEQMLWSLAKAQGDRRVRALAVAKIFAERRAADRARAYLQAGRHGVRAWLALLADSFRLARAERLLLVAYRARLRTMGPQSLSDRGLARFIFGHTDLGEPRPAAKGAMPPAQELWEALDRLIAECHRQRMAPSLTLTAAMSVRGRLRAVMTQGGCSHAS